MSKPNIEDAVNRFLGWKLPEDFYPDGGVSFARTVNGEARSDAWWPVGTNLLTAEQARKMIEYVIGDVEVAPLEIAPVESDLQPHQQRVVDEKTDLDFRLSKLMAFLQLPLFALLSDAEQSRMRNQARFMDGYSAVLGERIEASRPLVAGKRNHRNVGC